MKQRLLILGVAAAMAILTSGCAITDYDGWDQHQTQAEAKLWGAEVSFITGDPTQDGTFAYTVKYDNRGGRDPKMKIISYRNPVPDSFSRDGQIDRDGDDIQGRGGVLGGSFQTRWVAVDPVPGCQFDANITQSHPPGLIPPASLCDTVEEEIDKDLDLQASFASTGDLLSRIWSGAVTGGFTAELNGLRLGGASVSLPRAVSIGATSNGTRPTRISIDLTQPGGRELIQTLLANTQDGVPVSVGLRFEGGMALDLPGRWKVAFHHDALRDLL